MDRVYNIDAIMAAADRLRDENEGLRVEVLELRGRLKESRLAARRLQNIVAEGRHREQYWRQLIVAAVGIAVALTSMLFTAIIVGGGWM